MSEMTIGCALWTLGPTPTVSDLARQMEVAAEIGCTSVQPWIVHSDDWACILDPEYGSASDRREARQMAESLGLTFSGFCAQLMGAFTFGGLEERAGLRWRIDKTKRALETTAEMGGNVVTTHPGVLAGHDKLSRSSWQDHAGLLRGNRGIRRGGWRLFCAGNRAGTAASSQRLHRRSRQSLAKASIMIPAICCALARKLARSRVCMYWATKSSIRMPKTGIRKRAKQPAGKGWYLGMATCRRCATSDTRAFWRSKTRPATRTWSARYDAVTLS